MAISILKKQPSSRLRADVNFLITAFKEIAFFSKHLIENGLDALRSLCKSLQHQNGYQNAIVFSTGIENI